jgi:putative two-component system response regulator
LHDVGKIGLPDSILLKPASLTPEEYEIVKKHCDIGQHIVQPLSDAEWKSLRQCSETDFSVSTPSGDPLLVMIANIARSHHERWDGTGYPRRLKGDQIPLESRITSVADVFDALTTKRPYKPAFEIPKVMQMIAQGRGTQFDPQVVDALDRCLTDVLQISKEQADE